MLDQNQLFREHALGQLPATCSMAVTDRPGDAGVPRRHLQLQARTERELRARDDGAVLARRRPRRLHREGRPRNGARADGLDAPTGPKARGCRTSASTAAPRRRQQDGVRPDRQVELGRRGAPVRHAPAARLVLRARKLWSYFVPAPPDEATLASLQGLYTQLRLQHPRGRRGDPAAPRLPQRPGARDAAGRLQRRACCARSAGRSTRRRGRGCASGAGQQLFYPPNVSGWDFTHWLDTSTAKARWEIAELRDLEDLRQPVAGRRRTALQRDRGTRQRRSTSAMAYWGEPAAVRRIGAHASPTSRRPA